jgi:dienelactone hydrolase
MTMRPVPETVAVLCALALTAPAAAGEPARYAIGGTDFAGYYAPAEGEARGLVVLIHDWDGMTSYEQTRADMLSAMGYDAFALDLFGAGNRPETTEAKRAATRALYSDRETMRRRIAAGIAAARDLSDETPAVVAGYCFGGAAVLELARSGVVEEIAGYASFHGGLETPEGQGWSADVAPIYIAHGGADEAVPLDQLTTLVRELESAGVTYQAEIHSGAPHAFTVFGTDRYRGRADAYSWASFSLFVAERLGE